MALELTLTITEMITRNIPGDKGQLAWKANNLAAICVPSCLENVGALTSHNPIGLHNQSQQYL
jgi:hypothetical protein